ncbi:hypothetical protein AQUCO_02000340v1 [Aquilegia coerulea]|uniref:Carotenoid oxygenase n=1 Tax=Aquilegia coerulea TaxID=218851 RepID=A0A2G5DH54_AQUCA|nr:hypothetical protein AQUCO_02000340v1 [Aquilegia coerulea]
MASSCSAFQLTSVKKTSISPKSSDLRNSLSTTVLKAFRKKILHIPMELNVSRRILHRTIKDTSSKMLDAFVDSVFKFVDQPYLPSQSNFAPVEEIGHDVMIDNIEGQIPTDFPMGVYVRNGANPLFGGLKSAISLFGQSSYCWLEGEGMLHALYFTSSHIQVPKPTTSQVPKPTTSQVPKPTTYQVPKPTTSQVPKPTTSQVPKLTTSQVPKPTTSQVLHVRSFIATSPGLSTTSSNYRSFNDLKNIYAIQGAILTLSNEVNLLLAQLAINDIFYSQECWTVLYNNKYVETETFIQEKSKNKPSFLPVLEGNAPAIFAAYFLNLLRFGKPYKYISNTNIFEHSGKLYSIAENHLPQVIDVNTLETISPVWDVEGAWKRPFTAHPKKAPGTGELVIIGVDVLKPFFVLRVISVDGKKLLHEVDLKFKRNTICHEIGITEKYVLYYESPIWIYLVCKLFFNLLVTLFSSGLIMYNIIMDCPLTVDINRLMKGGQLLKYDKEDYANIGVMPRYGEAESVRWFEVAPHCLFHIFNCYEHGDEVVVRGCRALESIVPGPDSGHDKTEWFSRGFQFTGPSESTANNNMEYGYFFSRAYEWRLNMITGEVKEKHLTGTSFSMEFPVINEKYTGIRNKYGYTQVVDSIASSNSGLGKFGMLAKLYFEELATRPKKGQIDPEEFIKVEYHKFEKDNFCSGATFVSKHGHQDEDDGWILCFVHNEETNVSQVHIIDTKNFEAKPVVKITLPQRVPYGFHGAYIPNYFQQQQI